ncbi:helix-turn-helix domain-containing protein [Roseovarius sp. MMSF_3281]|uniref:helix-turn-helix domain-containing protein n=1 Tax=Roseovarius sp. MMSF_3281 TaxID=3046694 RepID=UPI00273D047D|nr:helix-turn-helix domain-containing protein [Roseovarius sp. MMSF_3281]
MTNRLRDTLTTPLSSVKRHVRITEKLGPCPGEALRAMAAYGMNDREIARYYGLTRSTVKRLRRALPVQAKWATH